MATKILNIRHGRCEPSHGHRGSDNHQKGQLQYQKGLGVAAEQLLNFARDIHAMWNRPEHRAHIGSTNHETEGEARRGEARRGEAKV
jgi:hypothetical protein